MPPRGRFRLRSSSRAGSRTDSRLIGAPGAVRRRSSVKRSTRSLGRSPVARARTHLRNYRKASLLAVALTGFLLLFTSPHELSFAQQGAGMDTAARKLPDTVSIIQQVPLKELQEPDTAKPEPDSLTKQSAAEARQTLRDLWYSFYGLIPKLAVALGVFLLAWLLMRIIKPVLRRTLRQWARADAITALISIAFWLAAVGVAFSVLAGDIRALLGSLGLIGLALSWALQTPIESFTGWLLNSFRGYYRVGDRIAVGDVFGDVFHIDFLTTTVWEYGGPDRPPGFVQAEQPTGRLITFPNNEILTGTVVNYTRDFAFVWDELTVSIAPESDIRYALEVYRGVAVELLGTYMAEPARTYEGILLRAGMEISISPEPQAFVSLTDWGANLTVRYLVAAREKRRWKSDLSLRVVEELNRAEHQGRIVPVYPRQQVQLVRADGTPFALERWEAADLSSPPAG